GSQSCFQSPATADSRMEDCRDPSKPGTASAAARRPCSSRSADIVRCASLLRQSEDRQYAALIAVTTDIAEGAKSSEGGRFRLASEFPRDADAGPSADAGKDSDILLSIGTHIRDGITDDPRWRLELPQDFAGFGVQRFQPPFHRPVENHVSGRRERPA